MKKIITLLALIGAVSVEAADHVSASFVNPQVRSFMVTNASTASTYGGGITNLDCPQFFGGSTWQTNIGYTRWTNYQGVLNITSNTAPTYAYTKGSNFNLIGSVPLWSINGVTPSSFQTTNGAAANAIPYSYANLFVRAQFGADHDAGLTLRFCPSPDGVNVCTNAASAWIITVQPGADIAANYQFNFVTNAPMHLWAGCKSLVLTEVFSPEVEAACAVWVHDISLNGFVP